MNTLTTIFDLLSNPDALNWIFGGSTLAGFVTAWKFRRQNKKLKQNEVTSSNTKTQEEQIDLGIKFIKASQEAVETIQKTTHNIDQRLQDMENKNEERLNALEKKVDMKMTNMNRSISSYNKLVKLIIKFLNGSFDEFQKQELAKAKKGGKKYDNDETAD